MYIVICLIYSHTDTHTHRDSPARAHTRGTKARTRGFHQGAKMKT